MTWNLSCIPEHKDKLQKLPSKSLLQQKGDRPLTLCKQFGYNLLVLYLGRQTSRQTANSCLSNPPCRLTCDVLLFPFNSAQSMGICNYSGTQRAGKLDGKLIGPVDAAQESGALLLPMYGVVSDQKWASGYCVEREREGSVFKYSYAYYGIVWCWPLYMQ
jgi:hypothetical protein